MKVALKLLLANTPYTVLSIGLKYRYTESVAVALLFIYISSIESIAIDRFRLTDVNPKVVPFIAPILETVTGKESIITPPLLEMEPPVPLKVLVWAITICNEIVENNKKSNLTNWFRNF
jgi:hypothetical protein